MGEYSADLPLEPGTHIDRRRELAAQPPLAVSAAKHVITAATDAPREAALLLEQLAYAALNRTG
ncbi:hypothetical protein [Streptomyces malaysiensis]|uniref:hypothetical protein n=1 Tax=Streptomyces malaysiensis TaxID=92644 RepID=UPI00371D3964